MITQSPKTEIWGSGYLASALKKKFDYSFHRGRDSFQLGPDVRNLIILHSHVQRTSEVDYLYVLKDRCQKILQTADLDRVIFISSVALYGYSSNKYCDESASIYRNTIYQKEKFMLEKAIVNFCEETGVEYYILRLSNLYGSLDTGIFPNRGFFWALRNAIFERSVMQLNHGGRQLINFIHIDDACDAIFRFNTLQGTHSGIYNIASTKSSKLLTIVDFSKQLFGDFHLELHEDFTMSVNSHVNTEKIKRVIGTQYTEKWKNELQKWNF